MIGTLRRKLQSFHGIEVGIFIIIVMGVGYVIDRSDPLLIHYKFNLLTLWLAIITLYYGVRTGLLMWSVFFIILFYTNKNEPILIAYLLENLFFVALFGLFFHNNKKKNTYLNVYNRHLKQKLKELENSFFTLKISHDKLESMYISQPTSLRYLLSDLLNRDDYSSVESSGENLLKVLEKTFMVRSSMLWEVKDSQLSSLIASNGQVEQDIDFEDMLIVEALKHKDAMYLKDLIDKEQTKYIFTIPFLDENEEVISLLIIQDIPFLFYKEDFLLKINVMFHYLWTELQKRLMVKSVEKVESKSRVKLTENVIAFKSEVIRLQKIEEKFNIESRIYTVRTKSAYLHASISDYFAQNNKLTILDYCLPFQCQNHYVHFVILSFASSSNVYSLEKDFDSSIEAIEKALEEYLSTKNYTKIATKSINIKYFNQLWEEYECVEG